MNENTFSCVNCLKENKNVLNIELTKTQDKLIKKFQTIIDNTNKEKNDELFNQALIEFNSIKTFTTIIFYNLNFCSYSTLLSKRSGLYFDYCSQLDIFLEEAIKNRNYYDIYSCVNECFLLGNNVNKIMSLEKNVIKGYPLSNSLYSFICKQYKYKSNDFFALNQLKMKSEYKTSNMKSYIKSYIYITGKIKELKNDDILIENKSSIMNMKQDSYLTKYYESYFKEPGKLIFQRKSANYLLYEIIINAYNQLCKISPTKYMIDRIISEIDIIKSEANEFVEILRKCDTLQSSILQEYGPIKHYYSNYKKEKVERPFVNFTKQEIQTIKEILNKKDKYENFELNVKNFENDKILQISIDFLYYIKRKGNFGAHILGKERFKFHQELQNNYVNKKQNEDINSLIIDEIKIKEIDEKIKINNLIDYVFDPKTDEIYDAKNKVDFIYEKYKDQFNSLTMKNKFLDNKYKEYDEIINKLKSLINNLINDLPGYKDKWD